MAKRGRKPLYDLTQMTCPNRDCPDFGKAGENSIVSNGTYATKKGKGRRYKCKTCGESFCRRSGTIFEGFHAPEEEIISALKLLAKGIPVRKASEILWIKPDTLRRWLAVMSARSEAVNRRLLEEQGISEAQLDTLWGYVREGALRKRAIIWRKRCGWRQSWDAD